MEKTLVWKKKKLVPGMKVNDFAKAIILVNLFASLFQQVGRFTEL